MERLPLGEVPGDRHRLVPVGAADHPLVGLRVDSDPVRLAGHVQDPLLDHLQRPRVDPHDQVVVDGARVDHAVGGVVLRLVEEPHILDPADDLVGTRVDRGEEAVVGAVHEHAVVGGVVGHQVGGQLPVQIHAVDHRLVVGGRRVDVDDRDGAVVVPGVHALHVRGEDQAAGQGVAEADDLLVAAGHGGDVDDVDTLVRGVGAVGDVERRGGGVDEHRVHHRGPVLDRRDLDAVEHLAGDRLQGRLLEAAGGENDGHRREGGDQAEGPSSPRESNRRHPFFLLDPFHLSTL